MNTSKEQVYSKSKMRKLNPKREQKNQESQMLSAKSTLHNSKMLNLWIQRRVNKIYLFCDTDICLFDLFMIYFVSLTIFELTTTPQKKTQLFKGRGK